MLRVEWMTLGICATNCYFLINEESKEAIVVDPADKAARIVNRTQELGVTIKAIFLTHGHGDHTLAVDALRQETGAEVYACEAEERLLLDPNLNLSPMLFGRPVTVEADVLVKDGQELEVAGMKWKVLHTPGHTKGGCCYYQESSQTLISGDTLFRCSVGRTDFPGGSMSELVRSIEEKLFTLPEETIVYPGHDRSSDIGYEKKFNPYVRGM